MTSRDLIGAVAAALCLQACALPAAHGRSSPRTFRLRYDASLAAAGFPSPLVRVEIGGRRVWLLVDSGAGVHTMASWLVSAAGLRTRDAESTVTGSTGREQRVRAFEAISARLEDGRRLAIPEGIVADFPRIFEEHEIGGLVSPQLLANHDAVVLDLRAPSMIVEPWPAAIARLHASTPPAGRVCSNSASPFRNRLYAAPATAADIPMALLVDTGATRTVAGTDSRVAQQLASQSIDGPRTQGVGGTAMTSRRIPGVAVTVDGLTSTLDLTIGAVSGNCGPDGLLGMDVLKSCVVVLGESAFGWSCSERSEW